MRQKQLLWHFSDFSGQMFSKFKTKYFKDKANIKKNSTNFVSAI